jgi:hypothetical protein
VTPDNSVIQQALAQKFTPLVDVKSLRNLKEFTALTREKLRPNLAAQRAKLGVVSVDFAEESTLVRDCVARSIVPPPPAPTGHTKFIAGGKTIWESKPDGSWAPVTIRGLEGDTIDKVWASDLSNVWFAGVTSWMRCDFTGRSSGPGASGCCVDGKAGGLFGFGDGTVYCFSRTVRSWIGKVPSLQHTASAFQDPLFQPARARSLR